MVLLRRLLARREILVILVIPTGLGLTFSRKPKILCEASLKIAPPIVSAPSKIVTTIKTNANNSYLDILRRAASSSVRLLECAERLFMYAVFGAPAMLLAVPAVLLGGIIPQLNEIFWMYTIWSIEMLGPAFVKMAQWASTRPDLYPAALTERLERLQDQVSTSYSIRTVERTLTAAFGDRWRESLRLEPEPIGSGCIAQVYRGTLSTEDGREQSVAVKVLHPNIERKVRLDMQLLSFFADALDTVPRLEMLSLGDTCRQFVQVCISLFIASALCNSASRSCSNSWTSP